MDDDGSLVSWKGLLWLGGGLAFHVLKRVCGREIELLAAVRKVPSIQELGKIADANKKLERKEIVAVIGQVNSDRPVVCKNSSVAAVMLEESAEQVFLKQLPGGSWVRDSTFLPGLKKQAPWFLEDSTGRAQVEDAQYASGLELVVASDTIESSQPVSSIRSVFDLAQGIRVLFVRRVERVLPTGTKLTVVGEVGRATDSTLLLRRPQRGGPFFVSTKSVEQLVSNLGASLAALGWMSTCCTVIGAVLIGVQGVRFVLRKRREARQFQPPRPRRSSSAALSNWSDDDGTGVPGGGSAEGRSLCIICLDRQYNVAFFPCGHVCCCTTCVSGLSTCPLCRRRISQKSIVFLH